MAQLTRNPRIVVLVEGESDAAALVTLAGRLGRELDAEGVLVEPIGGATSIGRAVATWGPGGAGARLAGLCDVGEVRHYARALERAGLGRDLDADGLERLGFGVCRADLEDELIRALGVPAVIGVLASEGELRAFRTLQRQPAQQGRPVDQQLRRFMGTRSGRKASAARAMAGALDLAHVPAPLRVVLEATAGGR
jgi:hypothetical protein